MKFLKCFNKFFVFLFAAIFIAVTSFSTYVTTAANYYPILGWKDMSNNNAVVRVEMWAGDQLPEYTGPDMPRTSTATFYSGTGHSISLYIYLKDGYELDDFGDDIVLYLYGVQTNDIVASSTYSSIIESSQLSDIDFEQNQEFYLVFKTRRNDPIVNNANLNITPPLCGTSDNPQISLPSDANYHIYGTPQWVDKSWDSDHFLDLDPIENLVIEGGKEYTFAVNVVANQNYEFGGHLLNVTANDGKKTIDAYDYSDYHGYFQDENDESIIGRTLYGDITAVHNPVEEKQNVVDPTCTEDGSYETVITCQGCNQEISRETVTSPATGHDWGEWEVTKEPTETEKGEKTRICKNDPSHIQTKEIPELGAESEETYYTVTFDNKGLGTAPKSQMVSEGETAIEPERLYADGYSFGGWYIDEDCTEPFDFDTPITSDITLYAKWIPLATGIIQTGDNSNLTFHSQMMIISLMGFILICYPQSRKKASLPK